MKFTSESFADGGAIPAHHAFCAPDPASHVKLAQNRNPHLAWSELPKESQSVVIICHDPDVPSKGDDVNKEGRTIPASLPRVNFVHWVLVDVPASGSPIRDGEYSSGVTAKGKSGPLAARNTRQGLNDYTNWFANDEKMKGDYYGYDGPCPPWNDSIPHHYIFTLFALDMPNCAVKRRFTAAEVLKAMKGHVLGTAKITGLYSLNPAVKV
jgi:Raf kinase inhibitor-like YbhB/YbcL family protein